jgi:RNA polymerase sigma factor (sigma-70 family)
MNNLNDNELLLQLRQGNQNAFRQLIAQCEDLVFNTALGILQNQEDAEDVTQDVFVQAFQSIHQFKGDAKISTWLYRITLSKTMDHLRKKKRKKRFAMIKSLFGDQGELLEDPPEFVHPGVQLDQKETSKVLFKAISQLPDTQRVAFTLNKVEGLSYQEISEIMENSVSAVESLMHRAKANLRKILGDYYNNHKKEG